MLNRQKHRQMKLLSYWLSLLDQYTPSDVLCLSRLCGEFRTRYHCLAVQGWATEELTQGSPKVSTARWSFQIFIPSSWQVQDTRSALHINTNFPYSVSTTILCSNYFWFRSASPRRFITPRNNANINLSWVYSIKRGRVYSFAHM